LEQSTRGVFTAAVESPPDGVMYVADVERVSAMQDESDAQAMPPTVPLGKLIDAAMTDAPPPP
jgi:hypothetical protein